MKHLNKHEKIDRRKAIETRAKACAETFAAHGHVCGGCDKSPLCPLMRLMREKYGPSILDRLLADPVIRQKVTLISLG
jgi:hypothetical protein